MDVVGLGRTGLRRLMGAWHRWEQQRGQHRGSSLEPAVRAIRAYVARHLERFDRAPYVLGRCNVCGQRTAFFCPNAAHHGDANASDSRALSYRVYGTELDERLEWLGFTVEYEKRDFPDIVVLDTELFFCRLRG